MNFHYSNYPIWYSLLTTVGIGLDTDRKHYSVWADPYFWKEGVNNYIKNVL